MPQFPKAKNLVKFILFEYWQEKNVVDQKWNKQKQEEMKRSTTFQVSSLDEQKLSWRMTADELCGKENGTKSKEKKNQIVIFNNVVLGKVLF